MTRMQNTYREVTGTRMHETDKAVQIGVTKVSGYVIERTKIKWFPRSQIQKSFYDPNTKIWSGLVAEWILEREGFMDQEDEGEDDPGDNTPEAYSTDDDDIPF